MNPYKSNFVQRLDRMAEKNPLLWLPCVVLLSFIFGIYRLAGDIKTICTYSEDDVIEKSPASTPGKKPLGMRILSVMLVFLLTAAFMPNLDISVYAEEDSVWRIGYHWSNASDFSIDTNVKYDGAYSIKIENTGYNDACVEKTYRVEPNTRYKLSAMVKYDGYSLNPDDTLPYSGATIGISESDNHSDYIMGNVWTELEFVFDTGNRTEVTLCLRNGMYNGTCRGTAWFSDVRLEKNITNPTNEWNVLAVVFKNVNTYATKDGISYNFVHSLDNDDVSYLTSVMDNLYMSFDSISGGRMRIKNIDVAVSDDVLTSISTSDDYAYMLDPYDPQISKILDRYLEKGGYNQIIAISPIRDIAGGWAGLGGSKYKNINFCQINYRSGDEYPGDKACFPDALFVHEMLHGMETDSKLIDPDKTPGLHDNLSFGFTDTGDEWREWYTAYMCAKLPGGKGLAPSVYQVYNDFQYVLVSNSMSVESEIVEYEAIHVHSFGTDWKVDEERHWNECDCGERSYEAAHIMGSKVITVQPTEDYAGVITYSCTVCGNVIKTETIPALVVKHRHSFDADLSFDDMSHWYECECGIKGYEAAHIIDEGVVTVQPAEYSAGIITYSCTVCGNAVKTEVIPALAGEHHHSFGSDQSFDDASHWYECECGERNGETSHIVGEGVITIQPTEGSEGVMTYSCTVCGFNVKTERIPAIATVNAISPTDMDDINGSDEPEIPDDPDSYADTMIVYSDPFIPVIVENVPVNDSANIESFDAMAENRITGQTENIQTVRNGRDYTADVGSENQGYYANIYTADGEFLTDVYINNEIAEFTLEEDIGFYIMIDEYPHSGSINNSNNIQNDIPVYNSDDINDGILSDGEEDIASGAGVYGSPVLMETADIPVSDGVRVPVIKLTQIIRFSNKKRRFRILRKEKLDDMVFVY